MCACEEEWVRVVVKVGAYFRLEGPDQLRLEWLHWDFADSLLAWDSPCITRRSQSCSLEVDAQERLIARSLDPDCECHL